MRIAAVVILYHPTGIFLENIASYYDGVEKIFIFNNSGNTLLASSIFKYPKIVYYNDCQNAGIAVRLNTACKLALEEGYDWLLTMDQDSKFLDNSFIHYLGCLKQHENKNNVALFGTTNCRESRFSSAISTFTEQQELMISGMFVNLSVFEKIGNFNEDLFIDYVDSDYCIQARLAGYFILQFSNIFLKHELGELVNRSCIKTFFLLKKQKEIHSPIRCYYLYRNMLYLQKKYHIHDNLTVTRIKKYTYSHIKTCLLYGRSARQIIKYLIAAHNDFKNNRFGKIN